jgi:hypothetical protein
VLGDHDRHFLICAVSDEYAAVADRRPVRRCEAQAARQVGPDEGPIGNRRRRFSARHQVWLAAVVADYVGSRSLLNEIAADPTVIFRPEWVGVDPTTDPVLATYFLFHDADLATLRAALPTVACCDLSAVYGETPTEDPARLPSTYLLPAHDRTLSRASMERFARERLGVERVVVEGAHNCYFAHADTVAEVIIKATWRVPDSESTRINQSGSGQRA